MKNLAKVIMSFCALMVLASCTANNTNTSKEVAPTQMQKIASEDKDGYVYTQEGMEVSAVISTMANTLYDTMRSNLSKDDNSGSQFSSFSTVDFPTIGIASFFDTDTYEDAGYLGREVAEFFVHEMNKRGVTVSEFKLTGKLKVTKEGDYIMSRNYRDIAKQAHFQYMLSGSMTRNEKGIVLVARIINLKDSSVLGSATGFVPYKYLPNCYQTSTKNCSLSGVKDFIVEQPLNIKEQTQIMQYAKKNPQEYEDLLAIASGTYISSQNSNTRIGTVNAVTGNGATSDGNYSQFVNEVQNKGFIENTFGRCTFSNCDSSVVYRANSSYQNNMIVRDIGDQSQYERLKNK